MGVLPKGWLGTFSSTPSIELDWQTMIAGNIDKTPLGGSCVVLTLFWTEFISVTQTFWLTIWCFEPHHPMPTQANHNWHIQQSPPGCSEMNGLLNWQKCMVRANLLPFCFLVFTFLTSKLVSSHLSQPTLSLYPQNASNPSVHSKGGKVWELLFEEHFPIGTTIWLKAHLFHHPLRLFSVHT